MLTIRNAQLRMLANLQMQAFRDETVAMLRRRRTELPADLPAGYLAELIDMATARCSARGIDQRASIIAFTESLLNDDTHPMPAPRQAQKADEVERELDTRALFMQHQALEAALLEQAAEAAAGDPPTQETPA